MVARRKGPDQGTPEVTDLEEQNVELPARHQQPVVGLQPLHLGGSAHGALLGGIGVRAHALRLGEQLRQRVARGVVAATQRAQATLDATHGARQAALPLSQAPLPLAQRLQHGGQLLQQGHHRDGVHRAPSRRSGNRPRLQRALPHAPRLPCPGSP